MAQNCSEAELYSFADAAAIGGPVRFEGKRAAMLLFSYYPSDPRPRRAAEELRKQGMRVDLICLQETGAPAHEELDGISVLRIPIDHRRTGKLSYAYRYSAFILICGLVLAVRSLQRRYDLVYVNNMPDVLVASALFPKLLGAKVLLDLHDPMPELMTTIFGLKQESRWVRLIQWFEKWSIGRADSVVTVNEACKRIFVSRGCPAGKIAVVMNSPDERIFSFRAADSYVPSASESSKRFAVMYHGTIVERNGLDVAVQAIETVRRTIPQVELRVYGRETPFLRDVLMDVDRRGMRDCVSYLGQQSLENLVTEIQKCDVGIIPNQSSPFGDIATPTRLFEYLALGKPVIAPRTPGILQYFRKGSLFFFSPGDPDGLAEQITQVALNPSKATTIAARGQLTYLEHTWERERQRLSDLIGMLLEPAAQT